MGPFFEIFSRSYCSCVGEEDKLLDRKGNKKASGKSTRFGDQQKTATANTFLYVARSASFSQLFHAPMSRFMETLTKRANQTDSLIASLQKQFSQLQSIKGSTALNEHHVKFEKKF